MRKLLLPCVLCVLLLSGCSAQPVSPGTALAATFGPALPSSGDVIEIREKMFVAQTNDIYLNAGDYLGKTIKYEGLFQTHEYGENKWYSIVFRYGPGCCGNDGNVGFEVLWNGEQPANDDWVEVIGTLEEYEEDGGTYLRLNLSSLRVLDTRGAETVLQ